MDAFLDCCDLCPDNRILASKDVEAEPRGRNAIILLISDDLEQLCRAIATLGRDKAELGHVPTDGIRQHRSLTNQKLPAAMQHQARLLLGRLRRHKSHRRPRDRLADCGRIVGIICCALDRLLRSSAASASPCGRVPEAGGSNNARSDMPQYRRGRPAASRRTPKALLG